MDNNTEKTAENAAPAFTPNLTSMKSKAPVRGWIEWENGIFFDLVFLPRAEFQKLSRECTIMKFNPDAKPPRREQTTDPELLFKKFTSRVIKGWKGMTVRKAANLIPLDVEGLTDEQMETEVPFSEEQAIMLLKECYTLDTFLQESAMNLATFNAEHKDEVKN